VNRKEENFKDFKDKIVLQGLCQNLQSYEVLVNK
jgi:hypothetical protein